MKKKLLVLLLLSTGITLAQLPHAMLEPIVENTVYDNYIGSIWKNRKFKDAKVSNPENGDYTAELRYNILTDNIEYYEAETKALYRITPNILHRIHLEDEEFYYCPFTTQRGQNRKGYYALVEHNDTYRVYKKYKVDIVDAEKDNNAFVGSALSTSKNEGSIKLMITYYIEEENKIMEIPIHKKELLALIDDDSAYLKSFIKEEKLKVKKEEDLLKIIAKYNAKQKSDHGISKSLLTNRQ